VTGENDRDEGSGEDRARDARRGALKHLIVLGGAAFGCALAAPAAVFVTAPVKTGAAGSPRWVRTVRLEALTDGEPKKVAIVDDAHDAWMVAKAVDLGAVWLVRRGDAVRALSCVCPHLGCSVNAEPAGTFACPCHTSAFAADGARVAGPAPRDMDALDTKIEDGFVVVDFRKFRIGIAEREQVG
jgi:cytochrome b6-f complex iron-sulfur subunit/menaquinol-cytochrome c reductase iron-sulfur subunit